MAVKLHRCSTMWLKVGVHPCWKVQKALDDAGVEYEVVQHPVRRGKRDEFEKLSGQRVLPAIELEDGTVIREQSRDLATRIKEGRLRA
ncbi:MAG TPA: glutathione S-transferase N-terminal domain-containing protein [Solirubrobacterales bacterium]|jgi:glutaredoxin